jgi:hypothetical protein
MLNGGNRQLKSILETLIYGWLEKTICSKLFRYYECGTVNGEIE